MPDRPHLLILMPDQLRADCLGCAGHPTVRTPNIDRIAADGVRFSQATTVSPVCMSARASFISGRYPHNHGMWTNSGELPADDATFFHLLRAAGYHTAHVGKSHYYSHADQHMRSRETYMHARGFETVHETTGPWATTGTESYMTDRWRELGLYDAFRRDYAERKAARSLDPPQHLTRPSPLPAEEYLDSYVGRIATEFVRDYDDPRPLCLFVGFPGPHEPWDAPGEYATMYPPASVPDPIPVPEQKLPEAIAGKLDFERATGLDADTVRRIRANYYGKISLIDRWVGEILGTFEARGWLDDLHILFWSDHGEMAGDHGRLYKGVFHESSIRVPFIVRAPGRAPAGTTSDAPAETVDLAATLLDLAGLEPSARVRGASLLPSANNPQHVLREDQLSEIRFGGINNIMLRSREHKYVVDQAGLGYMLYGLANDPTEQRNLAGDAGAAALEGELRERLFRRLLASQDQM